LVPARRSWLGGLSYGAAPGSMGFGIHSVAKSFLTWGLCPQTPGIYRFCARMLPKGRLAPPSHSGR
jgi:hypothetical protein